MPDFDDDELDIDQPQDELSTDPTKNNTSRYKPMMLQALQGASQGLLGSGGQRQPPGGWGGQMPQQPQTGGMAGQMGNAIGGGIGSWLQHRQQPQGATPDMIQYGAQGGMPAMADGGTVMPAGDQAQPRTDKQLPNRYSHQRWGGRSAPPQQGPQMSQASQWGGYGQQHPQYQPPMQGMQAGSNQQSNMQLAGQNPNQGQQQYQQQAQMAQQSALNQPGGNMQFPGGSQIGTIAQSGGGTQWGQPPAQSNNPFMGQFGAPQTQATGLPAGWQQTMPAQPQSQGPYTGPQTGWGGQPMQGPPAQQSMTGIQQANGGNFNQRYQAGQPSDQQAYQQQISQARGSALNQQTPAAQPPSGGQSGSMQQSGSGQSWGAPPAAPSGNAWGAQQEGESNQQAQQRYQAASGNAFATGGVVLGPKEPQQTLSSAGTTFTEPGAAMRRYDPISPAGPKPMFGPKPEEMGHHLPTKLRLGNRLSIRLPRPTMKGKGGVSSGGKH